MKDKTRETRVYIWTYISDSRWRNFISSPGQSAVWTPLWTTL